MIWIDFDNAPHVPLLQPLVREFERRGISVFCTARDFTQTIPMLDQTGIRYTRVGKGFGTSRGVKIASLALRLGNLLRVIPRKRIRLAINHGSRTQTACARLLGIPCIVMADYEYTESLLFRKFAHLVLTPDAIPLPELEAIGFDTRVVRQYAGFKEDLYLPDFRPEPDFRRAWSLPPDAVLVTLRPPGILGNYHDPRSEDLCAALIDRLLASPDCYAVLLPKSPYEKKLLRAYVEKRDRHGNWIIPETPLPGLQLIWNSDLVVSGGGTMNRESALLGVPTYSIFTGRKGAVDRKLEAEGRLTFLSRVEEVQQLPLAKRSIPPPPDPAPARVRDEIVRILLESYHQTPTH